MESVSEKIKLKREALNMTQEFIADKLGITSRAYQNYEYGKREPKMKRLKEIAELLGVSVNELLGEQNVPPETSKDVIRQDKAPKEPMPNFTPISTTDSTAGMAHTAGPDQKPETLDDAIKAIKDNAETMRLQAQAIIKLLARK